MNFHTTKWTGRNNKTKSLLLEIETGFFLYSFGSYKLKNHQKDEHDQSNVKIRPNSTLGLFWFKRIGKNAKVK